MSRYRIDEPIPTSTTAHIYGPDGRVIGQIYGAGDPDTEHLKRFIEDYDEIVEVLRNAAKIGSDIAAIALLPEKLQGDFDYGDAFNFFNQVGVLLECIDGKEAK
jgi:hypothetical protein